MPRPCTDMRLLTAKPYTLRPLALAALLCWLWFSLGVSFSHTCLQQSDKRIKASSVAPSCVACQWLQIERIHDAAPPDPVLPARLAQDNATRLSRLPVQTPILSFLCRAPPSVA
jgi:hypothetical protein